MKSIKPAYIIVAVIVFVIAAFALPEILADQPGARDVTDGVVTETIAVVDTNTEVVFAVRMLEGSDPEHESEHMFEALAGLPGVGTASLNTETLELTVAYDNATTTDAPIRDSLVQSGYVAMTAEDATPTEVAEDGSVQRLAINDPGSGFDPAFILAKSGVPIEFSFAPGQECRVVVKFPELDIEQDISEGGVVTLPALEAGQYQIACGGDGNEGMLIVE